MSKTFNNKFGNNACECMFNATHIYNKLFIHEIYEKIIAINNMRIWVAHQTHTNKNTLFYIYPFCLQRFLSFRRTDSVCAVSLSLPFTSPSVVRSFACDYAMENDLLIHLYFNVECHSLFSHIRTYTCTQLDYSFPSH